MSTWTLRGVLWEKRGSLETESMGLAPGGYSTDGLGFRVPKGSMYPCSIYLGLKGVPIYLSIYLSIYIYIYIYI